MYKIYFLIILIITSCSSPRKRYPIRLMKNQKYFGHSGTGFGVLKNNKILYFGSFNKGYKNGWFKIIYPDGTYLYEYYVDNQADTSKNGKMGYLYYKGNSYLTHSRYGNISAFRKAGDKFEILNFSNYSNDSDTIKPTYIIKDSLGLNYKTQYGKQYYTSAGHKLKEIKYINDKIYMEYEDILGKKFKSNFVEKTSKTKNGLIHTFKSDEALIEISKIVTEDYIYEGETKNGLKHGWGHIKYKDNSSVYGWFNNDNLNGTAIEKESDGDIYHGFYKNNKKEGDFIFSHKTNHFKDSKVSIDTKIVENFNNKFKPYEDWYLNQKKAKPSKPSLDSGVNFGKISYNSIHKRKSSKSYNKKYNSYSSFSVNVSNNILSLLKNEMGLDYKDLLGSKRSDIKYYKLYKEDNLIEEGNFSMKKICSKPSMYSNNCSNPRFYMDYFANTIIRNPIVNKDKITGGYYSRYNIFQLGGYDGLYIDNKLEGLVIDPYKKGRIYYKNNKINGKSSHMEKDEYFVGNFSEGKKKGEFKIFNGYRYYNGKYKNNQKEGKFKFKNYYYNIYGFINYINDQKNGLTIFYRDIDNSIYEKYNYINGKREGKALCINGKITEDCEYSNGERIDQKYIKRQKIAEDKRRKRKIEEDRRERQRQAERARWERKQRREARERKRAAERRRIDLQNHIINLNNSIRNTNPYRNFNKPINTYKYQKKSNKNYKKNNKYNKRNKNNSSDSNRSVITLTRETPYKECLLKETHRGQEFTFSYDCNRINETRPKAEERMRGAVDRFLKQKRKEDELKRAAEERRRKIQEQRERACREFIKKTGHACGGGCASLPSYRDDNCKVLSK